MTYEQAKQEFTKLFKNQLTENEAKELLVSLYQRGETSQEIAAAASVMREHSVKLNLPLEVKKNL